MARRKKPWHGVFKPRVALVVQQLSCIAQLNAHWQCRAQQHRVQENLDAIFMKAAQNLRSLSVGCKTASREMAGAAGHNWRYFYVLPDTRDNNWHDVHQQRLDSDGNAHVRVQEAIVAATKLPSGSVQVKAVHVDLFNDAYCFRDFFSRTDFIARPKTYKGGSWKPENKRFLARISHPPSHSNFAIQVENVKRLPVNQITCFDYSFYERDKKRNTILAADANLHAKIHLSVCSPLVFAVQASLAVNPAVAAVDPAVLGTAFLDIVMVCVTVTVTADHLLFAFDTPSSLDLADI